MKTTCTASAILLTAMISAAWASAPQFDRIYGSHMVLPHGKKVPITGTADPNKEVTVSFGESKVSAKADSQGKWSVVLPPQAVSKSGKTLTAAQGGDETKLDDVLVGEVWLASGQSNMLFRLNQSTGGQDDINQSSDEQLRLFNNVPQVHTNNATYNDKDFSNLTTDHFYKGEWAVSAPASSGPMSAVAYYFGKGLRERLDMPIGIIHSSLGGSEVAAWIPTEVINKDAKLSSLRGNNWLKSPMVSDWVRGRAGKNIEPRLKDKEPPNHPYKPGFLYDSGIDWVTSLPISGVIWYQGESDAEIINNDQNSMLLKTMIQSWRNAFQNPELPFVMIQLPRINDGSKLRSGWPEFREMQDLMTKTLPKTYCVNTIDLGSTNSDVHPPLKRPVGERAANTALSKIYGQKVPCEGPSFKAAKVSGGSILVQLAHADGLTTTDGQEPAHFEIAGSDGVYHPAKAEITSKSDKKGMAVIKLSSTEVKMPKTARYCWNYFVNPNLVNGDNLPARPFRSDAPIPKTKESK